MKRDDRSPRVRATGVDGASIKTDGESSELSSSVLFDTLAVAMRRSEALPLLLPPPREKMDRRLGIVSGDIAASFGDSSPSSKRRTTRS